MVLAIHCSGAGDSFGLHGGLEFAARLNAGCGGLQPRDAPGSAADAAAPALDAHLTVCAVAARLETMFVNARAMRGDPVAVRSMARLVATVHRSPSA
jgi:hypothetical protein